MDTEAIRKKALDDKYDPTRRNYFRYNLAEAYKDDIIITVFDELKQKRLIVDGLHRAAALTILYTFLTNKPLTILAIEIRSI